MSQPYIGEIRAFGFAFAPKHWAFCNGQLLAINQNQALFSLLGTYYGGNGTTTFALPDLRGRAPLHYGQGPGLSYYAIGEPTGTETVTLLNSNMPSHNHLWAANAAAGDVASPANAFLAGAVDNTSAPKTTYGSAGGPIVPLAPTMLGSTGSNFAHQNMQPYLVLNYCIALSGIFPSRN